VTATAQPYRYFVSYATRHGFGRGQVNLALPVRGTDDIHVMTRAVRDVSPSLESIVVLSWQEFGADRRTAAEAAAAGAYREAARLVGEVAFALDKIPALHVKAVAERLAALAEVSVGARAAAGGES
jgi:hypothetical protein